jgi:hypothetical protein
MASMHCAATQRQGLAVAVLVTIAAIVALAIAAAGPLAQDQDFHAFADTSLFGIRHFGNVASNAAYLIVGVAGLWRLHRMAAVIPGHTVMALRAWFAGFILVALGSAWYHAAPSDASLPWDRAAMTIVFAAASAVYLADRISGRAGYFVFLVLAAMGLGSQFYWDATGDLRLYRFVELLPFVLVPAICALYPGRLTTFRHAAAVIVVFALATMAEHFDVEIAERLAETTTGHTIKHLISAAAGWLIVPMVAGQGRRGRISL